MARKSRKHIEKTIATTCTLALRVTAYLRISEAKPRLPPESIENQLKIIEKYLIRRSDMPLAATKTYSCQSGIWHMNTANGSVPSRIGSA